MRVVFMKRILTIITFLHLFVSAAQADTGFVFRGKIGNYPIEMTIWATATSVVGEYYYLSQGKNKIELDGNAEPNSSDDIWIIKETVDYFFNGFFRLKWDRWSEEGQKVITGEYINTKLKHFSVSLKCVKIMSNPEHC